KNLVLSRFRGLKHTRAQRAETPPPANWVRSLVRCGFRLVGGGSFREKASRPSPQSPKGILGLPSPYADIHRKRRAKVKPLKTQGFAPRPPGKKAIPQQNLPVSSTAPLRSHPLPARMPTG